MRRIEHGKHFMKGRKERKEEGGKGSEEERRDEGKEKEEGMDSGMDATPTTRPTKCKKRYDNKRLTTPQTPTTKT
jgi:hypothetical protein